MIFPGCCCESNKIETQRENNLWIWECYRPESGFLDQRTRTSQTSNINAKNFSRKKVTWLFCQTSKGLYKIWPFFGGLTLGDTLKHFWIAFWILYRFSLAWSHGQVVESSSNSGRLVCQLWTGALRLNFGNWFFACLGWVLCFAGFHKILLQIFLQSLDLQPWPGPRKFMVKLLSMRQKNGPNHRLWVGVLLNWISTNDPMKKKHHEFL